MSLPLSHSDFFIVGAGIAGLRAAIELASAGTVSVLAKGEAHSGVVPTLGDEEEISLYLQDTLQAGDGLCNPEAARVLIEEASERIEELIRWGTEFDRHGTKLTFMAEGAHNHNRVLHARGESTGREILHVLNAKAKTVKQISICQSPFTTELLLDGGRVCGLCVIDERGEQHQLRASAVLLATGGLGQLYRNTTNPSVATGDGVAMAFRAGAEISDMEFIQFHPTAMYLKNAPRFMLAETLCGEGAYLRNLEMRRFMPKYHPMGELAPRDVVVRAIMHELEVSRAKEPVVYLDLTHRKPDHVRSRFARIYATCLQYNIDISTDLIPVRPAAQYAMGGVRSDLQGRTSLPGLYVAGEVAATGVHGANRLASNSLLEGLVFGARAGAAMRDELRHVLYKPDKQHRAASNGPINATTEQTIAEIQDLMWQDAGIVRTGAGLKRAIDHLDMISARVAHPQSQRGYEALNLHIIGSLVARSALAREESRGAHYRTDFPVHNDAKFLKHSVIKGDSIRFV
jgi:L-aspartate oxidase